MFKNLLKKLAVAATMVCLAGGVAAASACSVETDHPVVRFTLEFNGAEYNLDYTLYRNMYPNTVRHFMELTDSGFYNGTVIHDYRTTDWLGGGYAYNAEAYNSALEGGTGAMADYLGSYSKEDDYYGLFEGGKLTPTVYGELKYDADRNQILEKEDALPTLIGEFKNNINQVIEKGALTADVGTLKMYYYAKDTEEMVYVKPTSDQIIWADYKNNCATSVFAMQTSSGSSISEGSYCVFGRMNNTDALTGANGIVSVVRDYLETLDNDTIIVSEVSVDNNEAFSDKSSDRGRRVSFTVTYEPIIVKSVSIVSY